MEACGSGAGRRELSREQEKAIENLKTEKTSERLWEALCAFQGYPFWTARGLSFTYQMKANRKGRPGNEIVFSRKEKSVTRATVEIAYRRALELDGAVAGPKKLGCFGASYLYPVLQSLGVITSCEQS